MPSGTVCPSDTCGMPERKGKGSSSETECCSHSSCQVPSLCSEWGGGTALSRRGWGLKMPQLQYRAGAELGPALQRALATPCTGAQPRDSAVGTVTWSHSSSTSHLLFHGHPTSPWSAAGHPRQHVPPGSCSGTGWPHPSPLPEVPPHRLGQHSQSTSSNTGGLLPCPGSTRIQSSSVRTEDGAVSLWSTLSAAGPCSQHSDTAQQFPLYTGHWTELPHASPKAQGSTFFPRGKGEFSTEDGRSISVPAYQAQRALHARQLPGWLLPEQMGAG